MRRGISSPRFFRMIRSELRNALRSPNRDALLDQEGTDLIDRCCATQHQPRSDPMQGLQIKLILRLLGNRLEIGTQRGFSNRLRIVTIVFWPLLKGFT